MPHHYLYDNQDGYNQQQPQVCRVFKSKHLIYENYLSTFNIKVFYVE